MSLDKASYSYLSLSQTADGGRACVFSSKRVCAQDAPSLSFTFSPPGLRRIFEAAASSVKDIGTPLALSIPSSESLVRIVRLPGLSLEEAKSAFRYEFGRHFPFPADESVYDIAEIDYPLPDGGSEKRFAAVAARYSLVRDITDAASGCGFTISSVEPAHIALERAAAPASPPCGSAIMAHAGFGNSDLILSYKGSGIFYRSVALDFEPPNENTEELYADFAREILSSLRFAQSNISGFDPEALRLFGPGASKRLAEALKEALGIERAAVIDCFSLHSIGSKPDGKGWETALGLALR